MAITYKSVFAIVEAVLTSRSLLLDKLTLVPVIGCKVTLSMSESVSRAQLELEETKFASTVNPSITYFLKLL